MNADRPRHQPVRSKRAQYVNQACVECKRRKVRCNGAQPCQRCASLSTACMYSKPSSGVRDGNRRVRGGSTFGQITPSPTAQATPSAIQDFSHGRTAGQMLSASSSINRHLASPQKHKDRDGSPEFCGPSSSEFALNVASDHLEARGMTAAILAKSHSNDHSTSAPATRLAQYGPFMKLLTMDPLWDIQKDHAIDLINKWFNSMGAIYPVVEREIMIETAENVFDVLESAQRDGFKMKKASIADMLFNNETNQMKIVLAIGRTIEGGGQNDQAQRLFQSTTEAVEGLIWNSDGINGIQLLVLAALYYYHLDEEVRTGRIVGLAARLCLEMGLHRQSMVERIFPGVEARTIALKAFFSVYMLERRTSLGQGIPFSIQDSHVDPVLFSFDTSNPTLPHLLHWTRLAGSTWHAVNSHSEMSTDIAPDSLEYLDFQTLQWYNKLPENLKVDLNRMNGLQNGCQISYKKAVLFTRKSHLRNLIYRPVLQSPSRLIQFDGLARMAIDVAKEALDFLKDLYYKTNFVQSEPIFFKHLWLTALGNLLLAIVNSSFKIWDHVRADFEIALGLIKALSGQSVALKRLWQRLQGLEHLQTRLSHSHSGHQADNALPDHNGGPEISQEADQSMSTYRDEPPQHITSNGSLDADLDPMVLEQLTDFFNTSVAPNSIFEFPFVGWDEDQY